MGPNTITRALYGGGVNYANLFRGQNFEPSKMTPHPKNGHTKTSFLAFLWSTLSPTPLFRACVDRKTGGKFPWGTFGAQKFHPTGSHNPGGGGGVALVAGRVS